MMKRPMRANGADTEPLTGAATAVLDAVPDAANGTDIIQQDASPARPRRKRIIPIPGNARRIVAHAPDEHMANRQAELFYLQKQILQQTHMIFVMEDGAQVQGVVEWYDRHSIKVRGKSRVLLYKSAIKYLYKAGESGTAPGE